MSFQPAIKWSGSKRSQADEIIKYFPDKIKTYYEPFLGGGSIMYRLLNSHINVDKIIVSDINKDLIDLWNKIKDHPEELVEGYFTMWKELNEDDDINRKKEYYYEVRKRFNINRQPIDFLFLNRTATNGLIRYNGNGDFNTSFHFTRKGIEPQTLKNILLEWSKKINDRDVQFIVRDYQDIKIDKEDFMYLDPPYFATKGIYYGNLNYEDFWGWLRSQKGGYLFSFDGISGDNDRTFNVPSDLYDEHKYINSGVSSFSRIKTQQIRMVKESLYIKNIRGV